MISSSVGFKVNVVEKRTMFKVMNYGYAILKQLLHKSVPHSIARRKNKKTTQAFGIQILTMQYINQSIIHTCLKSLLIWSSL